MGIMTRRKVVLPCLTLIRSSINYGVRGDINYVHKLCIMRVSAVQSSGDKRACWLDVKH